MYSVVKRLKNELPPKSGGMEAAARAPPFAGEGYSAQPGQKLILTYRSPPKIFRFS